MKHVLLVHDQQEDPVPRRQWLENSGFLVTTAESGEEALAAIARERPDCVLLDVLIKGKNGFEVLSWIRERHPPEEVPVILTSTIHRKRLYREEAWERGAQGYLLRPIDPAELVRHILAVTQPLQGKIPSAS